MSFHDTHRLGQMEAEPDRSIFKKLLAETLDDPDDQEHCSVGVTGDGEWDISAYGKGHVISENLDADDIAPRHMPNVPDEKIIDLWNLLAEGKLDVIEREPWQPGYGS